MFWQIVVGNRLTMPYGQKGLENLKQCGTFTHSASTVGFIKHYIQYVDNIPSTISRLTVYCQLKNNFFLHLFPNILNITVLEFLV